MPEFQTVLFVCTGNIYRSRFAEALFNHRASSERLAWRAESRGFQPRVVEGGLSIEARRGLEARGISRRCTRTLAAGVREGMLAKASLIVLMKGSEHLPMLEAAFPAWRNRVKCWEIHDIDVEPPEMALPKLEREINELVDLLVSGYAIAGPDAVALEF